jgi:hypothetical protein
LELGCDSADWAADPFRQIASACLMKDALEGWADPPPQAASVAARAAAASKVEMLREVVI